MRALLRPALVFVALMTLLTGVVYPAAITGLAQLLFPSQANGSLVEVDGTARGSRLIGQPFSAPGYLWSRPSATGPTPNNAAASSGSNLGPSNPALRECGGGADRRAPCGRLHVDGPGAGRSGDRLGERARPAPVAGCERRCRCRASPGPGA